MNKIDYIVVGQGLVGTLVAFSLLQRGKSIKVIDNNHRHAASKVAAGIINPVTGKKYVKSWKIDKLIPEAREIYTALENQLEEVFLTDRNMLRVLPNNKSVNNWEVRKTDPLYDNYIARDTSQDPFPDHIRKKHGWGEVTNALHVHLPKLIAKYSTYLKRENLLVEEDFNYEELEASDYGWRYNQTEARQLIFCEGYKAHTLNPYFSYLPFQPAKGEAVFVRLADSSINKMLKDREFLLHIEDNLYWSGGGYDWTELNEIPTKEFYIQWKKHIEELLKVEFSKEEHIAGVRPSVTDRRPMVGRHPTHKNLIICNGMGTKGTSLAPYCIKNLLGHLEEQDALDKEIDVARFENLFVNSTV